MIDPTFEHPLNAFALTVITLSGKIIDGIYVFNDYGLASIVSLDGKICRKFKENDRVIVAENLEDAQAYLKYLSKCYYREFHDRAKKENLNINDFRFYLVKLDSSKFKGIKFKDTKTTMKKEFAMIKLFNFELKENKDK